MIAGAKKTVGEVLYGPINQNHHPKHFELNLHDLTMKQTSVSLSSANKSLKFVLQQLNKGSAGYFYLINFITMFHHEMLPTSFKDLFQKTAEVHCHNTRYATNQNYFIQQVSTNAGKKTISNRGATHWANLDQQLKDKSHIAFSNHYRSFLLLQYG